MGGYLSRMGGYYNAHSGHCKGAFEFVRMCIQDTARANIIVPRQVAGAETGNHAFRRGALLAHLQVALALGLALDTWASLGLPWPPLDDDEAT